ncbi:hypothetical protein LINPERHAP2_LOCUS21290 [Linum perenne]
MVGRSTPLMSSVVDTGKLPSSTSFAKATESLICLPTMDTPLTLVFMLIVFILMRLIEVFRVTV